MRTCDHCNRPIYLGSRCEWECWSSGLPVPDDVFDLCSWCASILITRLEMQKPQDVPGRVTQGGSHETN